LAALQSSDFRLLLVGNFIGSFGLQMQATAIGWELYDRTHSAYALGLVGLVQVSPLFALALHAGHFVDTHDRRRVLIGANIGFAVAALGLALVSWRHAPVPMVYACLLVTGVARAFYGPTRNALIPNLVPQSDLASAVTWNSGAFQVAAVLGPAAAGGLIALTHAPLTVYVLATAAWLTYLVLAVRLRYQDVERGQEDVRWHDLIGGVRFVWRTDVILATITLDLFAVLLGGADTLMPIYARDILHVGPAGFGWLDTAPSIGAVLVAIGLASRAPLRRAGPTLLWAVAGFGVGTIVFGLSRSFLLSFATLVAVGGFDMVSVVVRSTLVPLLTPDAMRGRVGAINSLFIGTSNQLGGFESGVLAGAFGPVFSVVFGGVGTLLVVAATAWIWPSLRRLRSLQGAGGAGNRPPPPLASTRLSDGQLRAAWSSAVTSTPSRDGSHDPDST
jgi:MFS family permease